MSGTDPQREHTRGGCGLDVAAYALGALDSVEAEAFAEHLKGCAMCREELAEFQGVVDVLPISAPQQSAPASLRRRVLDAVEAEPRAKPEPAPQVARRRVWSWPSLSRPALALGAAVAVLAVALVGGLQLGQNGGSASARVYRARVLGSPGTAEVTVTGGHGVLTVHHIAAPPAGKIYEVWLGRPHGAPTPTKALFSVTSEGDGDVEVPGSLRGVSLVMVTPEPAGGSQMPTHAPILRATLS